MRPPHIRCLFVCLCFVFVFAMSFHNIQNLKNITLLVGCDLPALTIFLMIIIKDGGEVSEFHHSLVAGMNILQAMGL